MDRAHFTVVVWTESRRTEDQQSYDANQLTVCHDGTGKPVLAFLSSGIPMSFPVDQVADVIFEPTGASWCPTCSRTLDLPQEAVPASGAVEEERPLPPTS